MYSFHLNIGWAFNFSIFLTFLCLVMECHSVPLSSGIEAASGVIFPRSSMRMAIQPTPSFSKSQLIGMSRSLKASDLPPNSEVRSMGNLQSSRSMEDIRSTSSSDTDAQRDRPVITNYSPEGISSSRASAHDTPHVREREVRAIILTDGTPGDQELPLNEQVKPSGATHTSIFSAIHPALAAALSQDEKTPDKKQDKGRIQNINYSSAPLKGTEGRDRSSVGLSESMLNNQDMSPFHQRGSSIHKQTSRGSNLHTASSEDSADVSNLNMSEDLMIAKRKSSTEGNSAKQRDAYGTSDVSMSAKTESDLDSSSQEASSESVDDNTPQTKDEGKKEDIISSTAGQIWQNLFSRVKNTMNSLKHPKKTLNPTPKSERQENETRGEYTETDVHNMLHDIMQEIQMKNDKKGHRRGQNSNWNTNEVTRNEDGEKSMGGETKLLMTTKILVTPKIVAEAVRTSTKNMLHLRDQALSRTAAAKLLTEVQIKLAELLEPADTYASDNSIKPQEKLNGKDGVGSD